MNINQNLKLSPKITPAEFCFWLDGFLSYDDTKPLTKEEVNLIKFKLNSVFIKVTSNDLSDDEDENVLNSYDIEGMRYSNGYNKVTYGTDIKDSDKYVNIKNLTC